MPGIAVREDALDIAQYGPALGRPFGFWQMTTPAGLEKTKASRARDLAGINLRARRQNRNRRRGEGKRQLPGQRPQVARRYVYVPKHFGRHAARDRHSLPPGAARRQFRSDDPDELAFPLGAARARHSKNRQDTARTVHGARFATNAIIATPLSPRIIRRRSERV